MMFDLDAWFQDPDYKQISFAADKHQTSKSTINFTSSHAVRAAMKNKPIVQQAGRHKLHSVFY